MNPLVSPNDDTGKEKQDSEQSVNVNNPDAQFLEQDASDIQAGDLEKLSISEKVLKSPSEILEEDIFAVQKDEQKKETSSKEREFDATPDNPQKNEQDESQSTTDLLDINEKDGETMREKISDDSKEVLYEEEDEPIFDGTEAPGMEGNRNSDSDTQGSVWPDKAVAITHYVRQKSLGAMSTVLRRLSGKSDDGLDVTDEDKIFNKGDKDSLDEAAVEKASQKTGERSGWKPLSFLGISHGENKSEQVHTAEDLTMKGRIILYTKLGCQDCKEARRYLQSKGLKYVEINIDVFPSRKLELEKIAASSAVPRVFFNEVLIGGLSELKSLEDSGKLAEKIEYVVNETPSYEAPLPPLSGEDDLVDSGAIDELALIVRKMKEAISIKDRFYKMRRFSDCFLGSEAVDFLSEDQYLEREEVSGF